MFTTLAEKWKEEFNETGMKSYSRPAANANFGQTSSQQKGNYV